eukprot:s4382_g9.t1
MHHDGQVFEELQASKQQTWHADRLASWWPRLCSPRGQQLQPPQSQEVQRLCVIYFFYYLETVTEDSQIIDNKPKKDGQLTDHQSTSSMGPETRTVTLAPEKKKQKACMVKKELEFMRTWYFESSRNQLVLYDFPEDWKTVYDLMTATTRNFLLQHRDQERAKLAILSNIEYKHNGNAMACLRTAKIYKVDESTQDMKEEDITPEIWKQMDAADRTELEQFVTEKAFKRTNDE